MHGYFRFNERPEMRRAFNGVTTQETSVNRRFSATYVTIDDEVCQSCPIAIVCEKLGTLRDEPGTSVRRTQLTREEMKQQKANCQST